jgi:glycosyltransferase involved in cell wall biosynthesis
MPKTENMISIIICTYNREKYIYNVLKSLAQNDFPTHLYEIVLINNNSTDQTQVQCMAFQNDYPQIVFQYFVEINQGLSYARNRGIQEAKGDILIYVDDDAFVNKEYIRSYYELFTQDSETYAAGGPIIPHYETKPPKWFSFFTRELITGYLYQGDKIGKFKRKYPGGGNAAYRKEVFEKVGLFSVDLGRKGNNLVGAEEKDIFDKMTTLNMKFLYIPNAILYHIIPEQKLTKGYFNRLTISIGQSERMRTLKISRTKYLKRLFSELIKWGVSLVLCMVYTLVCTPQKGFKLIVFRWNVSKGLLIAQ